LTEQVAFLIAHAHLFTMRGEGVGYVADGAVAVRGDQIVAVGASGELLARFQAAETIDASDCAVLPGLIDAHMHTTLSIVRGVAQDVKHWMQKALAPYSKHITHEARAAGELLLHPARRLHARVFPRRDAVVGHDAREGLGDEEQGEDHHGTLPRPQHLVGGGEGHLPVAVHLEHLDGDVQVAVGCVVDHPPVEHRLLSGPYVLDISGAGAFRVVVHLNDVQGLGGRAAPDYRHQQKSQCHGGRVFAHAISPESLA